MSPEHAHQMGFREWTEHYEKEQEAQREQIGDLTKIVHSLSADVRTLVENQKSLFSRINRPQPVAAYVSALLASIAVMISFATLLVSPIKDDMIHIENTLLRETNDNSIVHQRHENRINLNEAEVARLAESARWIEKLEERYNNRAHRGLQ